MAGVPYKDSIVEKGRLCKAKRGKGYSKIIIDKFDYIVFV